MKGDDRLPDRFWCQVSLDESGCWVWTGAETNGYGRATVYVGGDRRTWVTHRLTYSVLVGEIPGGLELDHLCRNKSCCNPSHLEPVTRLENMRRSSAWNRNRQKTHCPQGHPYEGENLYVHQGRRHCLTCITIRNRRRGNR